MESRIQIAELRQAINFILDHLEISLGASEVELDRSLYWDLDSEEMYRMDGSPAPGNVGNLMDDWQFVVAAASDRSQALPLMLLHVAPLLRYLAEKYSRNEG